MAEIGGARQVKRGALSDDNWDLRWPKSIRVYAKMAREDAQVKSVLRAVTLPIERTTWSVEPNGADESLVRMVSEDLRLPVVGESGSDPVGRTGGRVSWREHLPWALKMLTFGHAFFEKVYSDGSDGPQRLRKIAPRLQDTIKEIEVAADGGLEAIVQRGVTDGRGQVLPEVRLDVSRLLAYVHEPESMDWTGTSILRPAYKHWRLKDQLLKLEADVLDRNGMGVPVYKSVSNVDEADLRRGEELASSLRSGESAGAAVPHDASLTIEGVKGQLVSPREAIEYHDAQIARTALAHALNLQGGGSYALADVQMEMFIQSLQTVADYVATIANKYLVEDMVEKYTGERVGPFPLITCEAIGSTTGISPEALTQLINARAIFTDPALEEYLRRKYELPAKDEEGAFEAARRRAAMQTGEASDDQGA